ncbi:MAG: hypothetical protein P1V51_14885 [Deltaproteobacteria bacterium]|nr:hypothetical protein [Deltaproteobacteria bacterium]
MSPRSTIQLLASVLITTTACGGPEEVVPLTDPLHECQSYAPSTVSRAVPGRYLDSNDEQQVILTAPEDLGGGFIELVLTTESPPLSPGFIVRAEGDTAGAIIAANAVGTADPTTMRGGFSAAPGQRYVVVITQGLGAPAGEYPVKFNLDYTFTGTMDCYEGNDSPETAKVVPVATTIQAHAMAGYTANRLTATPYDDWYRFTLNRGAKLEAALVAAPGGHRMRIRFWGEDGVTQLAAEGGTRGGEIFTVGNTFGLGTFLMSVEVADPEPADWEGDGDAPTFWSMPYTVELREVL